MRSLLIALTLLAAPVAAQDQTSTKEDFKEFTQAMSGRFRSEIKLIYDWPGHENKRGDVMSVYGQAVLLPKVSVSSAQRIKL